jgi:hypothetical protein
MDQDERKEFLLKKAEKVLLRSVFDDGRDRNESLVGIYDSTIEILSSHEPSLSLNKNVCHYRFVAGGKTTTKTTTEDRDASNKVIDLLNTEANLYRVLWLCCVILVSITDLKNRTTIDTLQTTIRQCELLIRILKQNVIEATKGNENDNNNSGDENNNIWDVRIRELTNNNDNEDDDEHDDDESENILSFSREQLEEEEQELLRMASAPIPTNTQCREENTHQQQQQHQQFLQSLPLIKPSRSLVVGSIISIIPSLSLSSPSSSSLSIPVELDDRGILRTCNGNDNGDNSWWALTSQSVLQELDEDNNNQSSTKVKITNIISNETAVDEHSSVIITLDVGRGDCLRLWREHLGKVKQYLRKVMEEQEEIKMLWSVDDVMMAQTKAKKSRISNS